MAANPVWMNAQTTPLAWLMAGQQLMQMSVSTAAFALTFVPRRRSAWSRLGRPHRLGRSRTPGFQPGNRGPNPLGAIKVVRRRRTCGTCSSTLRLGGTASFYVDCLRIAGNKKAVCGITNNLQPRLGQSPYIAIAKLFLMLFRDVLLVSITQ